MPAKDAEGCGDRRMSKYGTPRFRPSNELPEDELQPGVDGRSRDEKSFPGCDITGDELEFIKAMERYMREKNRPFPLFTEVLSVAKSLGYRKVEPAKDDPQ